MFHIHKLGPCFLHGDGGNHSETHMPVVNIDWQSVTGTKPSRSDHCEAALNPLTPTLVSFHIYVDLCPPLPIQYYAPTRAVDVGPPSSRRRVVGNSRPNKTPICDHRRQRILEIAPSPPTSFSLSNPRFFPYPHQTIV